MRTATLVLVGALAACAAACEKTPPPTPSPGPDGVEMIRGTERIGWDQQAADTAELATFKYAIYVDGTRSEVAETSCGSTAGANGFACSGRLPAMIPGQHTIELASFILDGSTVVESFRSTALRVNVTASLAGLGAGSLRAGHAGTTDDGLPLRLEVIADAVDEPSDIVFAPDGRLFVAERNGVLRVIDPDWRRQSTSRLDGEVLALAVDPDFARTRFVYVALAERAPLDSGTERAEFMVARYREVNGVLGERMVLLHGVPARHERPSVALGVGPDGRLYIALDDGGDARLAEDPASLNGKLLRLNRDGTTPDDQPAGAPSPLRGYRSPRGMDWSAAGVMWIADGAPRAPERLSAVVVASERPHRSEVRTSYALAANTDPSDAVFYRGEALKTFRGNLLVAAEGGSHILRVRFDPRSPIRVVATEKLLEGVGPIRALAVGPDGAIYFATSSAIGRLSSAVK